MNISVIFPGQGSQHPGMGQFLFDNFKSTQHLFEETSDLLGQDFKKLCFEGSEKDLALTENTQPALLLTSVASYRVLKEVADPKVLSGAGHSVGEYAAVVCAGSLSFSDAIKAVRKRGQAMQSAVPVGQGGMVAAMGLTPEQVETLCQWTVKESGKGPVEPANFNAPGQIVVSGNQDALSWMVENFEGDKLFSPPPRRTRLIPLKVSAPFHCSMMEPAEKVMAEELNQVEFKDCQFPVIQNVHGMPVTNPQEIKENLIKQISAPVRWVECVEKLKETGSTHLLELGAGQVLSGLVKKIDKENLNTFNMNSMEDLKRIEDFCASI